MTSETSAPTKPTMFTNEPRRGILSFVIATTILGCGSRVTPVEPTSGREAPDVARPRSVDEPPSIFARFVDEARTRSTQAYVAPRVLDPSSALATMPYDDHRRIRYRPEASLFRGEPGRFEVQFFHLGGTSRTPIGFAIADGDSLRTVDYDPRAFVFDQESLPARYEAGSYSGFRVHAPINGDAYRDEFLVFQGASYLRAVSKGLAYGLSARGLALDLGTARPEEFPVFDRFVFVRPGADDDALWILASLTSPRAEGAYAFHVFPGEITRIEVHARVFLRGEVEVVGLAPLTSMYLFGEDRPARFGDFRPEVHDSDTLVFEGRDGERLARPLRNPHRTTVSSFRLDSPRSFGLAQRDRDFDHYQDLEARYHERPSARVTPIGDWGPGSLRLLEITTELETDDDIGVTFVPDHIPADGLDFAYVLEVGRGFEPAEAAIVSATRIATADSSTTRVSGEGLRFLVDFTGEALRGRDGLAPEVTATGARVVEAHVEPNPFTGGARLSFELADCGPEVELRAFLRSGGDALTETWSYLWQSTR